MPKHKFEAVEEETVEEEAEVEEVAGKAAAVDSFESHNDYDPA